MLIIVMMIEAIIQRRGLFLGIINLLHVFSDLVRSGRVFTGSAVIDIPLFL